MKKILDRHGFIIALCAMLFAPCVPAQTLPEFLEFQTALHIPTASLSVTSVEFKPLEIVTNQVASWIPATTVVTNPPWVDNGSIITNEVNQQVLTDVLSTNSAQWQITVFLKLTDWPFDLVGNGDNGIVRTLKFEQPITVSQEAVNAVFGAAAPGLEFAAQNGAYKPTGAVRDAFLGLAAQVLSRNQ